MYYLHDKTAILLTEHVDTHSATAIGAECTYAQRQSRQVIAPRIKIGDRLKSRWLSRRSETHSAKSLGRSHKHHKA